MRRLYEIDQDIEQCIMNGTDPETGEFLASDKLNELTIEREKKIEGVVLYLKDVSAEVDAIGNEISNLMGRMNKLNKSADGMRTWLSKALNGEKFSTPRCACSFRESEAVVADNEEDTIFWLQAYNMTDLFNEKTTHSLAKSKIKAYLKEGHEIPGVRLERRKNLVIK